MEAPANLGTVPLTEEAAQVEIERMAQEMQRLFAQIQRDREEGERIAARTEAKMVEVRAAMARLEASR